MDFLSVLQLVWLENPTNPLLKVVDVEAVCHFIKHKSPNAIVVVDNTFLTPYFQVRMRLSWSRGTRELIET